MNRVLGLLALAVLATAGCRAYGPYDPGCGAPYGAAPCSGCGDACGCGPYGDCGCGNACGCEPYGDCGCCQQPQGDCCCEAVVADCPVCECAEDCQMFDRYCGGCCDEGCGPYGGGPYDYSACQAPQPCNQCGGGGCGLCGGTGCLGGPTPCGADCPRPCCASGDHVYNFAPGPPTGHTGYPYYTTRGPRDFLLNNPPAIGPY